MELPSKRSRSLSSAPSSNHKKPRLANSTGDDTDHNDKLRVEVQRLRDENRQLVADRDAVKPSKNALVERLTQSPCRVAEMQGVIQCVDRLKKQEKEAHRSTSELQIQTKSTESKGIIKPTVAMSKQTITEIDRFQQSCELWQTRLSSLSRSMERKVKSVEAQQVRMAVNDVVTYVELEALRTERERAQELLQWARWIQKDTAECLEESHRRTQSTEVFEAMEKQLLDDRIVELETQLAQKRAVEREKEAELASLRADQMESVPLNRVVSNEELEKLKAENKRLIEEVQYVKDEMKTKCIEIDNVKNENAMCTQQIDTLYEETRGLCEKLEKNKDQMMQQSIMHTEEMKKLQEQLGDIKSRETKIAAVLKTAKQEMEKHKQRKQELKILYAKFSSAMDSVSEKTMRLEELQQELEDAQSNTRTLQVQRQELQKQIAQSNDEKAAQLRETNNLREELVIVRKQCAEIRELESQQRLLASKLKTEIAVFKAQNEEQLDNQQHQSVGQPSNENDKQMLDSDSILIAQVAEKEALQMFLQRYYMEAEEKISQLREKVRVLESQKASTQETDTQSGIALSTEIA